MASPLSSASFGPCRYDGRGPAHCCSAAVRAGERQVSAPPLLDVRVAPDAARGHAADRVGEVLAVNVSLRRPLVHAKQLGDLAHADELLQRHERRAYARTYGRLVS
jgi:hypothetical protein